MSFPYDSRLWLATHLLYPNSSQAFDVYQSLMSQLAEANKKNKKIYIFNRLSQIVDRIPAVNSNKGFHVFENIQIQNWQEIYRRSNKDQTIVFVGYFIFELKLEEIAKALGIPSEKSQFLFQQTFRKTLLSPIKMDVAEKIPLTKFNERRVSYLYTSENLIDYCLGNLSFEESKNVELGLASFPDLRHSQNHYRNIVDQMKQILDSQKEISTQPLIKTSETLSYQRNSFEVWAFIKHNKPLVGFLTTTMLIVTIVSLRPQWIEELTQVSGEKFVVLQEVPIKSSETSEDGEATDVKAPLAKTSKKEIYTVIDPNPQMQKIVAQKLAAEAAKNAGTTVAASPNLIPSTNPTVVATTTTPQPNPVATAPVVPVNTPPTTTTAAANHPKHHELNSANNPQKAGGLFRGTLVVNDVNQTSNKITEKIVQAGGKKAGEVELGWRKSQKLSYYHFTLPENNVEELQEFLKKFGQLQIQFENHPRLMPAGVKRLIIEVKESD